MSWRLLNLQGAIGLAASLTLLLLLFVQKGETRHWRKQAVGNERLYRGEQGAHAHTIANYRAAAEAARAADRANAARVAAAQRSINERSEHDLETRLADARARAGRLQQAATATADSGRRRAAAMPAAGAAAGPAAPAAAQDRFSFDDSLIATEQAIQLDELIKWVKAQAMVDNDGRDGSNSMSGGR